ncbi:MAG: hypothetical protein P8Y11_09770, partial [Gemmatimonadales bacterium]
MMGAPSGTVLRLSTAWIAGSAAVGMIPAQMAAQVPTAAAQAESVAAYVDAHRREIAVELIDFL